MDRGRPMRRMVQTLLSISLAAGLLFTATISHAQYRASIQGVVTDQQGAVVPDAKCSLKNLETGLLQSAATDEKGIFNFSGLPPAKFTLTVEKAGFKTKNIENFGIVAEQANALKVQLDVGQTTESVTVVGDATPLLDTESADVSGTVKAQEFQKLASFGRDPFQLLQLAPGAFGDGAQGAGGGTQNLPSTTIGGTGGTDGVFKIENGGQITANGARTGENNYQIDGVGTTSVTWGGTSVITPNEDSVKEIKIVTDNYDAENGRYRGAQVQIISQNGTNNVHGSLYFKLHRPGLNAFTRYNGYGNGNVRDDNRFNDWGGSLGGPILKNRLFGFFSYETIDNNAQQHTGGGWYETDAFRSLVAGPNATAFLSYPGVAHNGGTQVDHDCTFAGLVEGVNCITIPGQGLNLGRPLTTGLGARDGGWDSPSSPGTGGDGLGGANNLDANTADIAFFQGTLEPSKSTHRQYNGRVDFNATSKDLLAVSFYFVPNASTGNNGNGDRQMNLFNTTYRNRAATAIWDHTFGASMANEARVNAAGWQQKDLNNNPNAPWGLPQVSFGTIGSMTVQGYGVGSFNGFDQWTYAAKDVLTKIHGAHTMKMGAEFTRLLSVDAPFWSDRPGYSFNNIWDFLNDAPISENAQFDPTNGVPSALRKDLRNNDIGFFFQDNWKVKPNLTVTAGVRWEYFGPIHEKDGKLATVVLGSGASALSGMHVRTGGSQYNAQKTNFGPQLGFAWSPRTVVGHDFSNRLVLRGGIGIAYNGLVQSNTLDVRFNPPFVLNGQTLTGCQVIPGDAETTGCPILYIGSFAPNVHSPYGYASNQNAIVTFGPDNLPTTGRADLTALPADLPTTYDLHYTLGGEYDLGHQWMVSAGYQGSQTRHLTDHYNLYNPASAAGLALNQHVTGVTLYANDGSAHFNALLLEAKHTFSQSFQFDTQYRLSHATDIGSNAYAGPNYQWNLATALGSSDYDVKHAFKVYGIWSPTIFHGSRSWMEKALGGWSLSGILNAHSGFPWNPTYSLGNIDNHFEPVFNFGANAGGGSADAGSGSMIPAAYNGNLKANFRSSTAYDANPFFTPPTMVPGTLFDCLFANPDPVECPDGQQGYGPLPTAPGIKRNSFRGPGYFDVDATLSKAFGIPSNKILGEHAALELRANFYNLFNKLNLANIQTDIFTGCSEAPCLGHLGQAQNALGARVVEIQARFSF